MNRSYIKPIDGIRVIALLGVFLYHLLGGYVPCGYLGVATFFTLAGFLTMQAIVNREEKVGYKIAFVKIQDKIKKLFPILLIVVLFVSVIMVLRFKTFLNSYPFEALSSLLFYNNYKQIFMNESYFEAMNSLKPLTHLWALSLEMQFYVVFFLLVFPLYKVQNKNKISKILIAFYIISIIISVVLLSKKVNLTIIYYRFFSRLNAFILGMITSISSLDIKKLNLSKKQITIAQIVLLLLSVVLMFIDANVDALVIGLCTIYPIIIVAQIYLYMYEIKINDNDNTKVCAFMSNNIMHEIVKRSYAIYLVHYPVIIFANRLFAHTRFNIILFVLFAFGVSIIISELLYRICDYVFAKKWHKVLSPIILAILFVFIIFLTFTQAKLNRISEGENFEVVQNNITNNNSQSNVVETTAIVKEETKSDEETNDKEEIHSEEVIKEITETTAINENEKTTKSSEVAETKKIITREEADEAHKLDLAKEKIRMVNQNIGGAATLKIEDYLKYKDMKITLIGDSVSQCAMGALSVYFPTSYLNAEGNRQIRKAPAIFEEMKQNGELGDVVVVALGTNSDKAIDVEALETVYYATEGRPMVILTVITPYAIEETRRNNTFRDFIKKHKNCYLADWHAVMKTHSEYFMGDNTHPLDLGNDVFAQIMFKTCIDAYNDTKDVENIVSDYDYMSNAKLGDTVIFGKYYKDNDYDLQSIEWIVVNIEDATHSKLLMSKYALDCKKFNKTYHNINWANCALRKWLNEDFYNTAFSSKDKEIIKKRKLENKKNPYYDTQSGIETEDNVFLLSLHNVEKFMKDEWLVCKGTEYFKMHNGYVDTEKGYEGNCDWWLRTLGDMNSNVANVSSKGKLIISGDYSTTDDFGVRPCIYVRYD